MKNQTQWQASDLSHAKHIQGPLLSAVEFQDSKGEWQCFDLLLTHDRVIFGGYTNACFLESGYILRDETESLDETLSELMADLECYYNDGAQCVSRIVCNERM